MPAQLRELKAPVCFATVKTEHAESSRVEESIRKFLNIGEALRVGFRNLGSFTDPDELIDSVIRHGCEGLILLVGSGGTEPIIVRALENLSIHTLLVSFEANNSLPAMLEAHAYLKLKGRLWLHSVYLDLARISESREALADALKPLFAVIDVKTSRIGVIGGSGPWLVYSRISPALLKDKFGVDLVSIPLHRLLDAMEEVEVPPSEVEMLRGVANPKITDERLEKILTIYYGLKSIVEGYNLTAVSMDCFSANKVLGESPCYAMSRLAGDGVDAECEGDLPGLLSVMLAKRLSYNPAMLGNLSAIRETYITLAHCMAPLSLASSYMLENSLEPTIGTSIAARLPAGRQVTLLKVDLHTERLVMFTGRIVESGFLTPRHCRSQVVIKTGADLTRLLEEPVGSHLVLTPGNIIGELRTVARLLGLNPVVL